MHNIATIYRFNTPFLDVDSEKKRLVSVIKRIRKSIEFDGILCEKSLKNIGKYYQVTLEFGDAIGRVGESD